MTHPCMPPSDVAVSRPGYSLRTTLWGLQRPPLNGKATELRLDAGTDVDSGLIHLLPFAMYVGTLMTHLMTHPPAPVCDIRWHHSSVSRRRRTGS